jgi:DNA-directed RNA polymerase specialized sigma24 family protein
VDDIETFAVGESTEDFADFYRRAEVMIRRALVAGLGPIVGADAASTAMAYGFEHWDRVSTMNNPVGYLYRVGRNSARQRRKPLPSVSADQPTDLGFEPGLPKALNQLSESQRQAVLLVNAWGFPLSEAADLLGVSISTLRNHLDRGMTRLRRNIGVHHDD